MTNRTLEPAEALDRVFRVIREEALANPTFGRRLLEAAGVTVTYRGEEAIAAVDPVLVALAGHEEFRRTFLSMKAAELKKIGEATGILHKKERLPKSATELVDLLWDRAQQRIRDTLPSRIAAE